VLLAHEDRETLMAADVQISYRPALPVYDPVTSPITFKTITIEKGRVEDGFAAADAIVEGEYRTGHQEQLYIEPNGVIAVWDNGGVTVFGSLQCPYYVHRALKVLLGLPDDKVRVVQTETGGGFGGKEEYPSMIAGHAALLARKAGRPVKLIYDRVEDMIATTEAAPGDRPAPDRRHPRWTAGGDGGRHHHGWRRLRDAECRRPVARRDPRERSVSLRSRPHSRARDDDEHAAQRRVPRVRRAADAVRDRSAHGPDCRPTRDRSGEGA
jgi:hypothetical protein